jgi:hypothetical protein
VLCGEIPGLPPLTAVAAGAEHALLSCGQKVYVIGRTIDQEGSVVVSAPWDAPVVCARSSLEPACGAFFVVYAHMCSFCTL